MKTLFTGSDVGGAKILEHLLSNIKNKDHIFVHPNGYLKTSSVVKEYNFLDFESCEDIPSKLVTNGIEKVIMTTSVSDHKPLDILITAKDLGLETYAILDNWMNYSLRFKKDNQVIFPDHFLVMDDFAKTESIKDGVPESIIHVVGHPIISESLKVFESQKREIKKRVSLILEPVLKDQGGEGSPHYRGYVEEDFIKLVANALKECKEEFEIFLLPHPRQNVEGVKKYWESYLSDFTGGVSKNNKECIYQSEKVIGMTSMLLYESFLFGKDVFCLQPNAKNPIELFSSLPGVQCEFAYSSKKLVHWLNKKSMSYTSELFKKLYDHSTEKMMNVLGVS